MTESLTLRTAVLQDIAAIEALIRLSVRQLSIGFYSSAQIESAIEQVFGVDSQLIQDGTYYVIEYADEAGRRIAASGGWSSRRTLFGGDQMKERVDPRLDPAVDPARIRAFFVHPDMARRGLARRLFEACEHAARAAGFREFELMATLPGQPLYLSLGFREIEPVEHALGDGVSLPLVRMRRPINPA